jgi:hypothetical protein
MSDKSMKEMVAVTLLQSERKAEKNNENREKQHHSRNQKLIEQ